MDHLTITDIDSHVTTITYNISRLRIRDGNSRAALRCRSPRQRDSRCRITMLDQTGAIQSYSRSSAAIHVRHAQLTIGSCYDLLCRRSISAI